MARRQQADAPGARRQTAAAGIAIMLVVAAGITACTPTVRVAADDPITINLNVNIQHDIRVRVERDLDDLFSDSGVF